ncbi:MAG: hypothetical protein KTR31_03780 [Myxococcales bacterium]|nr:hypothetical protein [Myxococcales bacterium]
MSRQTFLTALGLAALSIGALAAFAPTVLLEDVKRTSASPDAIVMARTVGALLLCVGGLNLWVRRLPDSAALRAILGLDLAVQLLLLPIDPWAWWTGVYTGLGSFVPNTILHLVVGTGLVVLLRRPAEVTPAST